MLMKDQCKVSMKYRWSVKSVIGISDRFIGGTKW